jgi:hypothetical protein
MPKNIFHCKRCNEWVDDYPYAVHRQTFLHKFKCAKKVNNTYIYNDSVDLDRTGERMTLALLHKMNNEHDAAAKERKRLHRQFLAKKKKCAKQTKSLCTKQQANPMQIKLDCAAAAKLPTNFIDSDNDLDDFKLPRRVIRRTIPAPPVKPIISVSPNIATNVENSFILCDPLCTSSQVDKYVTINIPSPADVIVINDTTMVASPMELCNIINNSVLDFDLQPSTSTKLPTSTPPILEPQLIQPFLLTSNICTEPPSFYSNDNISFFTHEQPNTSIMPVPNVIDTFDLINELCQIPNNLSNEQRQSQIVVSTESPMSPVLNQPSPVHSLTTIGNTVINAPFTAYPFVDSHFKKPVDYINPCRCCGQSIDFAHLLTIPHHLPKGAQIMCARCLLTFLSRPRDYNVEYSHRNLI